MSIQQRKKHHNWGVWAEYLCALWLVCKGYNILALRYLNPYGEIDIIAVRGPIVAFIEVKARRRKDDALYSVTPDKQQRIARAAGVYIGHAKKYAHHGLRFDVMVVTSVLRIFHLKDAWRN